MGLTYIRLDLQKGNGLDMFLTETGRDGYDKYQTGSGRSKLTCI